MGAQAMPRLGGTSHARGGFFACTAMSALYAARFFTSVAIGIAVLSRACLVPHPTDDRYVLEGAELQYKLTRHFEGQGAPPLEEVFFSTQNLTKEAQEDLMRDCPGLLITALIVVAEARLPIRPAEAAAAFVKADQLAARLSSAEYELAFEAWPVQQALMSYQRAANAAEALQARVPSVHLVVCHCGESLEWLANGRFHLPALDQASLHLFIYEKCKKVTEIDALSKPYRQVSVVTVEDGDVRRDECSAYLRHLVDHYADPADYTFFFQADAGDHMQWEYLSLVMKAIEQHALQAPFVHLNHPRLVSSLSPCREEVFRQIFGRTPSRNIGSYCCAQFVVSRERILANPLERYQHMQQMLFSDSPPQCHDIPGHSTHCLMFEVYWHVLFGEEDGLPARSENPSLPLFLRIRDIENESYLPPGSLYLQHVLDD